MSSKFQRLVIGGSFLLAASGAQARPFNKVTWYFQCPHQVGQGVPAPAADELLLVNEGPFEFAREEFVGVPMTVKGQLCAAESLPRDVVFIVDVSGSMDASDQAVSSPDGTLNCGRLDALKKVLAKLPDNVANVAVVTFGEGLMANSTRLWPTGADMVNELTRSQPNTLSELICSADGGSTNYDVGLTSAQALLKAGRKDSTKEIFFITDGEPNSGAEGMSVATDMKSNGVTIEGVTTKVSIATVMLGTGDATILKDNIASRDASGQPIFANAADASELADILDRQSSSPLVGASLIEGSDGTPGQTFDLMPFVQADHSFTLPSFVLDLDLVHDRYNLKLDYWDSHLNHVTFNSSLKWD